MEEEKDDNDKDRGMTEVKDKKERERVSAKKRREGVDGWSTDLKRRRTA